MTIVEFLNARLNEDEQVARTSNEYWSRQYDRESVYSPTEPAYGMTDSDEIPALFVDDQRILAEVEAKRAVLQEHGPSHKHTVQPIDGEWTHCFACGTDPCSILAECHVCGYDNGCPTVRYLAQTYADHPDYDPGWAP